MNCFACGKPVKHPKLADTRDAQIVFVGSCCHKKILRAGEVGFQPPEGPRLYSFNHKFYIYQVLCHLWREQKGVLYQAFSALKTDSAAFLTAADALFQELVEKKGLVACKRCSGYHRPDFQGDCDSERFPL